MATDIELDAIYDIFGYLKNEGHFEFIDMVLGGCHLVPKPIAEQDIDVFLAYLTNTLPIKSLLKNRPQFIEFVKTHPECTEDLLRGLE